MGQSSPPTTTRRDHRRGGGRGRRQMCRPLVLEFPRVSSGKVKNKKQKKEKAKKDKKKKKKATTEFNGATVRHSSTIKFSCSFLFLFLFFVFYFSGRHPREFQHERTPC